MKVEALNASQWVTHILRAAIDNRASDIHLEPFHDKLNICFRIDGVLYSAESPAEYSQEKILSRIKVLSQMDITEHRLPQEGQFEFNYKDRAYNIRVSALPTFYGEAIVLRILNRESVLIKLEELGFNHDQLGLVNKLIFTPSGIVLIIGPSGSGKTTLLYSILCALNSPSNNIITIEDPIEFQMPDIRQVQINESVGLSFAKAIRSALRQDPNIIMLGEIRDPETAQMAVQAGLTGILVFSTFHALDVPGLVTRLIEMDVPRSVVAQSIVGVISARLLRRVCSNCGQPYQLTDEERRILGTKAEGGSFRKGKGCDACRHSGYLNRAGIFEIVRFDDELRASIIEKKDSSFLRKVLAMKKIKSLHEVALERAIEGISSVEEAFRVTGIPTGIADQSS